MNDRRRMTTTAQQAMVEAYRDGLGPRAAARLTADELSRAALAAAACVDAQIARLHHGGGLKAVNRRYRDYRLAAAARGESTLPYAAWLARYKAERVRDVAALLR